MNKDSEAFVNPELEATLLETEATSWSTCRFSWSEIKDELKNQWRLGAPLTLFFFMEFVSMLVVISYTSHVGPLALSSASMAASVVSIVGVDVLIGLGGALETFCGQSFGVQDYEMMAVHMQRGILTLLLACIPMAFVWANTGKILLWLGQDRVLATSAGTYARFWIPAGFGYAIMLCVSVFLRSRREVMPLMIASAITSFGQVIWAWFLVFKTGLSGNGAAVSMCINYWLLAIILIAWVKLSPNCKNTKFHFSWEIFRGIPEFLRLAVPSVFLSCLGSWLLQIITVLSGMLPNAVFETSALTICSSVNAFGLMIPLGIRAATTTRVANELGAGNLRASRLAFMVALSTAVAESLSVLFITIIFRHGLVSLFSKDATVNKYAAEMLLIAAVSNFFSAVQCILLGLYNGIGCPKVGAIVNLLAYYVIGLPCALIFAFVLQFGGKGLWMGYVMAQITQVVVLSVVALKTDWQEEAKRARNKAVVNETQSHEGH